MVWQGCGPSIGASRSDAGEATARNAEAARELPPDHTGINCAAAEPTKEIDLASLSTVKGGRAFRLVKGGTNSSAWWLRDDLRFIYRTATGEQLWLISAPSNAARAGRDLREIPSSIASPSRRTKKVDVEPRATMGG